MLTQRFLHCASPMDTRSRNVADLSTIAHTVAHVGNRMGEVSACSR